jgi:branched-chain amino acid transport system substrate-binding protein
MRNFAFSGVTGTIKFLSWGDRDRIGKAMLVQVQVDSQASTGYSFIRKE